MATPKSRQHLIGQLWVARKCSNFVPEAKKFPDLRKNPENRKWQQVYLVLA